MANGEWDVFGPDWGLGLPVGWFDAVAIQNLLNDTLSSKSVIDQLALGWDGAEEDAWEVARSMLRACGYFVGETYEGKLTFARLRMADVSDMANPTTISPIPKTLRLEPGEGEGIDRLVATVGKTPWFEGQLVTVNMVGDSQLLNPPNSLRASIFAEEREVEMDLSVRYPANPERIGFELLGLVTLRGFGAPILYIRANDPNNISHGDMLKLGDPGLASSWFVDADGNKVEIDGSPKWMGQVIGFRRNLRDGSIDLTMVMHNWHLDKYPRLRAPSAVLASTISTLTYTLDENNFYGADGGGTDAEQFAVGDKVELFRPDFSFRSGTTGSPDVQTITAIGTNTITLDADFTSTGVVGDILRLARLSTAAGNSETSSARYPGFVAYAFMGDASRTVGPLDNDAHIYGFGLI